MQEISRYAVGVDVGTSSVKCVVATVDDDGVLTVVGAGQTPNSGMRKGVVVDLAGPAKAIDTVLGEVERMSGYEVNNATINIGGSHILSTKTDGMIAVGALDHEITVEDLDRVDEVAATGKIPANREILDLIPYSYRLDGQENIKDPVGMVGSRLEIKANVVSALKPHCQNVAKAAELANVHIDKMVASAAAAAKSVLNEKQLENGVALIDLGAATTGVVVFEEGELQFISVLPWGSNNITMDLAMALKVDTEVAEEIKRKYASAVSDSSAKEVVFKRDKQELYFKRADIDEAVEARLEEIFDGVKKDLKRAGYDRKLPEGVVLVGGGANLKDLAEYVKEHLELSVKLGNPAKFVNVGAEVEGSEFATAVGLAMTDAVSGGAKGTGKKRSKSSAKKGLVKGFFAKFKV
ncbi:MAG: cell division protein FtsA [Candidatus Nomurabacteria bacterium]|jgi:cell division protein FtsA|nr:cell division protein FtsA [Candidatus Nomurabacteria bacterium]